MLCVPVKDSDNQTVAVLQAANKKSNSWSTSSWSSIMTQSYEEFTEEDKEFLESLAAHAGITLRKSQV